MKKLFFIAFLALAIGGCVFEMNDDYVKGGGDGQTYAISGTFIAGNSAIAGMTVVLAGDKTLSTVTDATGAYSFADLTSGSYTVLPGGSGHGPEAVILSTKDVVLGSNSSGHNSKKGDNYTCSGCHTH